MGGNFFNLRAQKVIQEPRNAYRSPESHGDCNLQDIPDVREQLAASASRSAAARAAAALSGKNYALSQNSGQ